jgi:hypothetical protein
MAAAEERESARDSELAESAEVAGEKEEAADGAAKATPMAMGKVSLMAERKEEAGSWAQWKARV